MQIDDEESGAVEGERAVPAEEWLWRLPDVVRVAPAVELVHEHKVAVPVSAQLVRQLDVAGGQEVRPQSSYFIFGHLCGQQGTKGADGEVAQDTVQLHDYPRKELACESRLLLPIKSIVTFKSWFRHEDTDGQKRSMFQSAVKDVMKKIFSLIFGWGGSCLKTAWCISSTPGTTSNTTAVHIAMHWPTEISSCTFGYLIDSSSQKKPRRCGSKSPCQNN